MLSKIDLLIVSETFVLRISVGFLFVFVFLVLQVALLGLVVLVGVLEHLFGVFAFQAPADDRVVTESLNYCNNRLFVIPEHFYYLLTRMLEYPMDPTRLHILDQHPRQPKRHFLRKLTPRPINIKTIPKINMYNFPRISLYHDVIGVTVAQSNHVTYDGHYSQTSSIA